MRYRLKFSEALYNLVAIFQGDVHYDKYYVIELEYYCFSDFGEPLIRLDLNIINSEIFSKFNLFSTC